MLIDTAVAVVSVTAILAIVVAIDDRAGEQVARMVQSSASADGGAAVQLRDDTMGLVRSAWEMSKLHAPLMSFVSVAAVLVLFMFRTK